MSAGAWSYSRMKTFETCPKQFYHVNVLKEFPFQETDATRYGTEFHKAAEEFMRDDAPCRSGSRLLKARSTPSKPSRVTSTANLSWD